MCVWHMFNKVLTYLLTYLKVKYHPTLHLGTDMLLCFEMRAAQRRVMSKMDAKFRIFDPPPVKFGKECARYLICRTCGVHLMGGRGAV